LTKHLTIFLILIWTIFPRFSFAQDKLFSGRLIQIQIPLSTPKLSDNIFVENHETYRQLSGNFISVDSDSIYFSEIVSQNKISIDLNYIILIKINERGSRKSGIIKGLIYGSLAGILPAVGIFIFDKSKNTKIKNKSDLFLKIAVLGGGIPGSIIGGVFGGRKKWVILPLEEYRKF